MSQKTNLTPVQKEDVTEWNYNDVSLHLDMQDVSTIELYEEAFDEFGEAEKSIPKDGKESARIRAFCEMFRNLFNRIFGEGTDAKLFGEKNNAREMMDCYDSFLAFVHGQKVAAAESQANMIMRYSPSRAQRRAAGKK